MAGTSMIQPPMNPAQFTAGNSAHLQELVNFYAMALRRGWRIIALSIVVCLTLAAIYLATTTRQYEARSKLLVIQNVGRPINLSNSDASQGFDRSDDYMPTHALIVSSPAVIKRAIESAGLKNLPTLEAAKNKGLDIVEEATERLKVDRPDRLAKILVISYRAQSRQEAVVMIQALVDSYHHFVEDSFASKSNEAIKLIEKARDELSTELDDLQKQYREFRKENKTLLSDQEGRSFASVRLEQIYRASNEAKIKAMQLRSQLQTGKELSKSGAGLWSIAHAMEQLGAAPNSGMLANTAGTTQGASLDFLRQLGEERQRLVERYGPTNARVQEINEQIERAQSEARDIRSKMERGETKDLLASVETSLKAIASMESELNDRFKAGLEEAKEIENDLLVDADLRGKMEQQRSLFQSVVEQLKQAQFVSEYNTINAQVIEPPNALKKAVSPKLGLTVAAALFFGIFLGVVGAVASEHLDQRLRTIDETRAIFNLPMLGLIPRVAPDQLGGMSHSGLLTHAQPHSILSESYRSFRTNLEFIKRSRNAQVIMITSPCSGDGKTTTSCNLATIIAHAGKRVLLIDADLRRPSLAKVFGLKQDEGLSQILLRAKPFHGVVQKTEVDNLDVLTSGAYVTNPAELLASSQFAECLQQARQTYDTIIIDTPPILAVTDASVVSAVADGLLLVVSAMMTKRFDAQHSMEVLKALGTPVLGIVINGTNREWFGAGFGYGSGYGYGYGYGYGQGNPGNRLTNQNQHEPKRHNEAPQPVSGSLLNGKHTDPPTLGDFHTNGASYE